MKKRVVFGVLAAFLVFVLPLVSAEILISQPDSLYNVGDDFNIKITLSPVVDTHGFFVASLVCDSGEIEIYKVPKSVDANTQEEIGIKAVLERFLTENLIGECNVKANYGEDSAQSQTFELSRNVKVNFDIDGIIFDPIEDVGISGTAIKDNGEPLEGFVEVSIDEINASASGSLNNGSFRLDFVVPKDAAAGSYEVIVRAYEKDESGTVMNEGISTSLIKVKQVIREIDVSFDSQVIDPGDELIYTVLLRDQAGDEANGDVGVTIYKPDNSVFGKKLVEAGEVNNISTETNYAPGYWEVEAKLGEIKKKELFFVEELENVTFELVDGSVVVVNTGNVPFRKPIEVSIGDVIEVKELDLGIGETERIRLFAPEGEYGIEVREGNQTSYLGTTLLTGSAISLSDEALGAPYYIWGLIIVVILLLIVVLLVYRRRRMAPKPMPYAGPIKVGVPERREIGAAKPSIAIEKGKREETTVIALKIKNLDNLEKLKSDALDVLNQSLLKAKDAKAKIYVDGNYRIMIFSPTITKEEVNELKAVKIGKEIEKMLRAYNAAHSDGIEFGIGVNSGEMIAEMKDGKFRFVSLGKTLSSAKKMAEASEKKVLLSESIHRKTIGNIKSEKMGDTGFYEVTRVTNREKHTEFIRKFLNRQKAEASAKARAEARSAPPAPPTPAKPTGSEQQGQPSQS